MVLPLQVSPLHQSVMNSSAFQWLGFASSASSKANEKETTAQSGNEKENKESTESAVEAPEESSESVAEATGESVSDEKSDSGCGFTISVGMERVAIGAERRRGRKRKMDNVQDPTVGVAGKRRVVQTRSSELVGRYVQKGFKGSEVLLGRITNHESGLYRINYEDGRCEDLINSKVKAVLVKDDDLTGEWQKRKEILNELLSSKDVNQQSPIDSPSLSGGTNSCTIDGLVKVQDDGNDGVDADSSSDLCEGAGGGETKRDEEVSLVPPPELPPSLGNIGVRERYVPHLLSVYSFLRSFSVRLFLYPFELDDFVGALNCSVANTLLDSVHVALLCFIKRQFEKVLSDGSKHESKLLSRLEWSLLDTLTWPIYLVHYLMAIGYTNRDDWKELYAHCMDKDYYALSVGKKLIILQILCDNVLDSEELRAEIDIREELEVGMDRDTSTMLDSCESARVPRYSKSSDCMDTEDTQRVEKHQNSLDNNCTESQVGTSVEYGNGDECRLCGMDGVLVCCDGCPSVYHSRCLGLNKTPNGSWYCPECKVDATNTKSLQRTALRGGEVFGVDPYKQVFIASFDHLLVVKTSINSGSCTRYYNRHNIPEVLNSLYAKPEYAIVYAEICRGIMQYWGLSADILPSQKKSAVGLQLANKEGNSQCITQLVNMPDKVPELTEVDNHDTKIRQSESLKTAISEPASSSSLIDQHANNPCASSQQSNSNMIALSTRSSNISSVNDTTLEAKGSLVSQELNNREVNACGGLSSWCSYMGSSFKRTGYINYYLHGDFSASAAANLAILSNEENQVPESYSSDNHQKVICSIALQVKAFSSVAVRFFWPNLEKGLAEVPRERCSWCFSCTAPLASKRGCLLNAAASNAIRGAMKVHAGVRPVKKGGDERLYGIRTYIMFMEENLSGLLVGPFLNDTFRKHWHRQLQQATTCSEIKTLLLELEENIRSIAFSGDWTKLVKGFSTQASTSEIAPGSTQKCRPGRRRKKQSNIAEVVADGFKKRLTNITWWRGGIVSKIMFQEGILPSSIIKKLGRQGGKKRIPGVCYVEGNEIPKISRQLLWRSAVETCRTVAHLALQVRYLDSHVRWGDLGHPKQMPSDAKSSEAEASAFRNAFIYGRKVEEQEVRYRVGFGSRKHLPLRVMKNIKEIEKDDEKERYWFSETFTPLYLIREYEQRMEKNKSVNVLSKLQRRQLKASRENIFSSLLWKQRNTARNCCSCHQDVFHRNAAKCHACQGFCHQECATASTVNMSEGIDFLVICKQCCETQTTTQFDSMNGSLTNPLLLEGLDTPNSAITKDENLVFCKDLSTPFGALDNSSKVKSITSSAVTKKNRNSNWGLLWRKKNCEDTGFDFRLRNILLKGNTNRDSIKPHCHLCDQPYNADLMYIHCETCKHWYHAVSVELDESKLFSVVGFKCCRCRRIKSPVCPFSEKKNVLKEKLEQHLHASKLKIPTARKDEVIHVPATIRTPATYEAKQSTADKRGGNCAGKNANDNQEEGLFQFEASSPFEEIIARQETTLKTNTFRETTNPTTTNAAISMQNLSPFLEQQVTSRDCFNLQSIAGGHVNGEEPPESVTKNRETLPLVSRNGTSHDELLPCKFCLNPRTDLCCQICSLRIHKTCSPWFEWSCQEDDWRCGSCREWS